MKTFAERLIHCRERAGLSQSEVARRLSITPQAVQKWEKGENVPRGKRIQKLASILDVSASFLLTGENPNVTASEYAASKRAPIISWVQAGEWSEALELNEPFGEWLDVPASDDSVFWLRVVGDSMTSPHGVSAPEGSLIKVDTSRQADNGSLVIAKLVDSQEVTFKKLVIDAGRKVLMPLNRAYLPLEINGNCTIVGVVTEIRMQV